MGRKKLPITGPPSFPIKRGCKKFPHLIGAVSIRAGDLSALSHNRAEVPLLQYRPLPPLEMTIVAGSIQSFQRGTQIEKRCTAYVIPTKAVRSGEISRPYGTVGMAAGDLGALRHNRAEVPLFQYRPLPPLEMTMVAGSIQSFQKRQKMTNTAPHPSFRRKRSGVEKSHAPMVQWAWSRKLYHPCRPLPPPEMTHGQTGSPKKVIKKAPREGELFSVLQASAAFAFLVRKY